MAKSPRPVVIDASVAMKWYIPEIHSEKADWLLKDGLVLLAPDLLIAEFGNILWKKVVRKEISPVIAEEILTSFLYLPIECHPNRLYVSSALKLASEFNLTVYDCLYLALAVEMSACLFTADRQLYETVNRSSFSKYIQWITMK